MIPAFAPETLSAPRDPARKLVLFHRDFQRFTGGHLKVWDYFNHVAASPAYDPRIAFTAESKWDATNPWSAVKERVVNWEPDKADILFLAGADWRALPESPRAKFSRPIINLIQHPRHADAGGELRGYLKHRAVRICVSEEVATAIKETVEVNGPVFVIPNGIDLAKIPLPQSPNARKIDILICGLKAPELAREVRGLLAPSANVQSIIDWIPRGEYLDRINDARITIFLPRPSEGFYLPALEGMALGTVVVCPDCIGNRGFCVDRVNCFFPDDNAKAIAAAVATALQQSSEEATRMREQAQATALRHSLVSERESFLRILMQMDELARRAR